MRYIGNKENLLDIIYSILTRNGITGNSFFDCFSGTTSVARYYKKKGYKIYSNDLLYLSYCLQKAYIENNSQPLFESLIPSICTGTDRSLFSTPLDIVVSYLNKIEPQEGFIYKNYTPEGTRNLECQRMYFSSENGKIIDAIRTMIEEWHQSNLITECEYFILISCLIESVSLYANVAGVYAAFQKKWDPRAIKRLRLRSIEHINNGLNNKVYNVNSLDLITKVNTDILYLDPPYNERQYLPNYHLIETIARYDNPVIKGMTGIREYGNQKSTFCNKEKALKDLDYIAKNAIYKYLVLSYNSEGIMPQQDILNILSSYGHVILEQFDNIRFKSNNNGLSKTKKYISEQLYILKKND